MKTHQRIGLLFALLFVPHFLSAQVTTSDYERAENFLQFNLEKHIYNRWIEPTWQENGNTFIYSVTTRNGIEFFRVNPSAKSKTPAFDQTKLALLLTDSLKVEVKPFELPISKVEISGKDEISFWAKGKQWIYGTSNNLLKSKENERALTKKESLSPDGNWIAFIREGNVLLREKKTGAESQLTSDGTPENGYGHNLDWDFTKNDSRREPNDYIIEVYWSNDSKKLIVPRFDRRNVRRLQLYKVDVEGYQSEIVSYERGLAGDTLLTMVDFYVFDVAQNRDVKIDLPSNPAFLGTGFYTFEGCPKAYHVKYYRGYKTRELFEIDLETGKTRSVLVESYPKTFVDLYTETLDVNYDKNEFIWRSEQDGWCHLYRYDLSTGKIKNQITKGDFYVYGIEHFDKKSGTIWFMAGGLDKTKDPYQKYLYTINLDGKNLKLLTPEEANHDIRISPDKKFFVDNYSSCNDPNIAVVRQLKNGKQIMEVEKTDIEDLVKMGWKPAETFSMLADDGKTMLYGTIIKPTNFDPTKKYPVIDGTYTGPHTIRAPKTFSRSVLNMDLSLAELGFVVVNIDGRGSAYRSKQFHDISYARLGYGLVDHVYVIRKLAEKNSYIDASRVGIYGHSAGGYDATRALLLFPEFYKVGVSSAGDHDHRMEKVWWPELYQGFPVDTQYHNQSNVTNASKLQGHLMIVTGDLDNNVNPSATYKLAGELTKANKDFELIVLPNENHGTCYWNKYFIRKRWDFFVKNLLGLEHPREYKIK
ncbi:MAG: DPP IV N-terminal domain-containing protein [Bacteroidales bacterium]|nr:DPP IV N-terminal domain-containing protein [Bacteroidales bacterium]